jgi:spermidine synthase/uncharacterized membrane protein
MVIGDKQLFKNSVTPINIGLFFICLSLLMYEVLSIRASMLLLNIDFTFFILPLALSGIGLGGIVASPLSGKGISGKCMWLFSLTYVLFLFVSFYLWSRRVFPEEFYMQLCFFLTNFFTYVAAGALLCLIFKTYIKNVSFLNALSLAASGIGAITVTSIMDAFGQKGAATFILILACGGVLAFHLSYRQGTKFKRGLIFAGVPIALLAYSNLCSGFLKNGPSYFPYKQLDKVIFSKSNSYSMVEASPTTMFIEARDWAPEVSKGPWPQKPTPAYLIAIDHRSLTWTLNYERLEDLEFLKGELSFAPFSMAQVGSALFIGSGGGVEVAQALLADFSSITALEINPLIVEAIMSLTPNNVYKHGNVRLVITEGRTFLDTTDEKFDIICLFSAGYYGGLQFEPMYLFTKEAFLTYLGHLKTGGILVIRDRRKFPRFYASISTLLSAIGQTTKDTKSRVIGVDGKEMSVIMFKRGGFSQDERDRLKEWLEDTGFKLTTFKEHRPLLHKSEILTDNRPFVLKSKSEGIKRYLIGVLVALLGIEAVLFVLSGRSLSARGRRTYSEVIPLGFYFMTIGMGFFVFENFFIQRFVRYLGNPTAAISVTLAAILLFGGVGSLISQALSKRLALGAAIITTLLFLFGAFSYFLFDALTSDLSGFSSYRLRVIIALSILAFPGLLMGMSFPVGLRITADQSPAYVSWMWAINGVGCVIGGFLYRYISLFYGAREAIAMGALAYLAGSLILGRRRW